MWVDTLGRVLQADGTEVIVCRNVTDVDDVLPAAANRAADLRASHFDWCHAAWRVTASRAGMSGPQVLAA